MSNNKWAAIVYSRTYEVDFRFLTMPDDFNDERISWAKKYINSTTRYPQHLPGQPCWSLFQDEKHCVVGVTCMVKELLGNSQEESTEDFTKDMYGRDLFIFVGYVAQIPCAAIPSMNLKHFHNLGYEYLQSRWTETSYEARNIEREKQDRSCYEKIFALEDSVQQPDNLPDYSFNENIARRYVWSVKANQNLWFLASQTNKPLSICLGLFRKKYFLDGIFLNGTALDIVGDDNHLIPERLQKEREVPRTVIQQPEQRQVAQNSQSTSSKESEISRKSEERTRRNQLSGQPNKGKSRKSTSYRSEPPEFYQPGVTFTENLVKELLSALQNRIEGHGMTFQEVKDKIGEIERNIQCLKEQISQPLTGDSFSQKLNEQVNQIDTMLEEVTRIAKSFGWINNSESSDYKTSHQEPKEQAKINRQKIEIDYGFQENSEKTQNRLVEKKWF